MPSDTAGECAPLLTPFRQADAHLLTQEGYKAELYAKKFRKRLKIILFSFNMRPYCGPHLAIRLSVSPKRSPNLKFKKNI